MKKLLILTVSAVLFAGSAQAATFVESRTSLGANDLLDWSVLGPGSPLSPGFPPVFPTFPNSFSTTSSAGLDLNVSIPTGEFLRIDQTPFFPGAFNVGEALLFTGLGNPGPLSITFDTPVFGAGAQLQSDPLNISDYVAIIEAFDSLGNSLGTFERSGVSRPIAGNGVIFVGIFDSSGDIKKLVFNTKEQGGNVPFALNAISIKTTHEKVPEPSLMLGLLVFGTAGVVSQLKSKYKH
ncbi:MAG TPA: PEP-CTERM sorting domain-containing protein [Cyanobacteria bacterium UBA11162]|nr:PEP-CTERM sorting domain-containing protein [Cyanobacteria bacterium UBA11162]